jgi:hypothetical protein
MSPRQSWPTRQRIGEAEGAGAVVQSAGGDISSPLRTVAFSVPRLAFCAANAVNDLGF